MMVYCLRGDGYVGFDCVSCSGDGHICFGDVVVSCGGEYNITLVCRQSLKIEQA